ncbi:dethiobiotin synthase [Clostridium lundense]|uniref:dethiobiotin synthase n=1 Tax=Clostridium lundense TaxID=319475 RepID=UPI00048048C0|nr:dethiobiotin synthase [Clostridium lundense]
MTKGIFITGTDTDVGKTIVTSGLLYLLRSKGYKATYFKAALSGAQNGNDVLMDTSIVCQVSNLKENFENITPYIFKTPVSPHLAGKIEGNSISKEKILDKYNNLKEKYDYIIVEGSGGIVCPLIHDEKGIYLLQDLIKDLNIGVIVVARAGLGTINHTTITVKYIQRLNIEVKGIIINGYKDNLLCNDNIEIIKKLTNVPILAVVPWIDGLEVEEKNLRIKNIRSAIEKSLNEEDLIKCMDDL